MSLTAKMCAFALERPHRVWSKRNGGCLFLLDVGRAKAQLFDDQAVGNIGGLDEERNLLSFFDRDFVRRKGEAGRSDGDLFGGLPRARRRADRQRCNEKTGNQYRFEFHRKGSLYDLLLQSS